MHGYHILKTPDRIVTDDIISSQNTDKSTIKPSFQDKFAGNTLNLQRRKQYRAVSDPSPQDPPKRSRFGAAVLAGLGAASTAQGGEGVAEAGERNPRRERARKRGRDTEPNESQRGGPKDSPNLNDSLNLEISCSPSGALWTTGE